MSYQYPFIPGHSSMPATPQTAHQWDGGDSQQRQQQPLQHHLEQQVLQHPLQRQPDGNQDAYVPAASSTSIQLQEQVPVVPSQNPRRASSGPVPEGDELQLRLQHVSVPALLRSEHMRPPMIDTNRVYHVGASASPPSGPSSAGPSGTLHGSIGPVRARVSPVHPDPRATVHPYRRPQSAAGVAIARSRREPEDAQSVRCPRRQPSSSTSAPGPLSAPPTTAPGDLPAAAKMVSTFKGLISPAYSATGANVAIRTDLHFNSDTSLLTALCELPGRSKSDVTVVLSTNPLNRVKQVVVTARQPREIAQDGCVLRERRPGPVSRTFVVPTQTTPHDISVEMRDGLLSLKIQCPPPSLEDDAQEIEIR